MTSHNKSVYVNPRLCLVYVIDIMPAVRITEQNVAEVYMSYVGFIKKNHLWKDYYIWRASHRKISKNRALRAFCYSRGFYGAVAPRKQDRYIKYLHEIASYEMY